MRRNFRNGWQVSAGPGRHAGRVHQEWDTGTPDWRFFMPRQQTEPFGFPVAGKGFAAARRNLYQGVRIVTVQEVRDFLRNNPTLPPAAVQRLAEDHRDSVRRMAAAYLRRRRKEEEEYRRLQSMWALENRFRRDGYTPIAGIDEAGRGPIAGPVVAAAVILPDNARIDGLNDSKLLSPAARERLYDEICGCAVAWGTGMVDAAYIDEHNILQATYEAMRQAVAALRVVPRLTLNDAVTIPGLSCKQVPVVQGDRISASIAAASVIAKVTRDRYMLQMALQYPEYGFDRHKGYPTAGHLDALSRWGPSPIHRRTFAPVSSMEAL
jgi:ribonuclease HII